MLTVVWQWSLPVFLYIISVSLVAGYVRGFAGFGYSALVVSGLSLVVAPAEIVLAVFGLEIMIAVVLLKSSFQQLSYPWLWPLLLGNLLFVPVGIVALSFLPEALLRFFLGLILLCCSITLRALVHQPLASTWWLRTGAGVGSGLLNGLAASGGLWAALLMASSRLQSESLRATMNVLLLLSGVYAFFCALVVSALFEKTPLLQLSTLYWVALLLPTMSLGFFWGHKRYAKTQAVHLRCQILNLLILISALVVLRALWDS